MELTPRQKKFSDDIAKLTQDSWDAGWQAACEEFVKIAEENGPHMAIAAMKHYL